jgi:hypothetical protein
MPTQLISQFRAIDIIKLLTIIETFKIYVKFLTFLKCFPVKLNLAWKISYFSQQPLPKCSVEISSFVNNLSPSN